MEFSQKNISMASLALLLIASFIGISEEIAVMSIDIGSEWMKVAIVSVSETFIRNSHTSASKMVDICVQRILSIEHILYIFASEILLMSVNTLYIALYSLVFPWR